MTKKGPPELLFVLAFFLLINTGEDVVADETSRTDVNVSAILDGVLRGYDKRIRPNYGGTPVDVGVTMYVISIGSLSEVQMDFTMDFYFRQFWKDNRLQFNARPGIDSLSVGAEVIEKIWVPDTFFANEKSAYFHTATTMNSFLRFSATGDVLRSLRLTVTAACPMGLQYFPMDRQLCTIEIESFGYTMKDIRYNWHKGPGSIGISHDVQLPQFRVLGHRQKSKEIILSTGNYSRLVCEIQFVRSMGYYLIQIYIPSSLIVIISWVSFWLNRNATPARVALGVTTVLTMTTLMSSTNAALPKISYVKSIDVYLGTCFVMVFASLLEYATVGYMGKRIQMRKSRLQALQKLAEQRKTGTSESNHAEGAAGNPEQQQGAQAKQTEVRFKVTDPKAQGKGVENTVNSAGGGGGGDAEGGGSANTFGGKDLNRLCGVGPSDIDKCSRVCFPVCFVCFNLMYWIIYLHISDVIVEDIIPLSSE